MVALPMARLIAGVWQKSFAELHTELRVLDIYKADDKEHRLITYTTPPLLECIIVTFEQVQLRFGTHGNADSPGQSNAFVSLPPSHYCFPVLFPLPPPPQATPTEFTLTKLMDKRGYSVGSVRFRTETLAAREVNCLLLIDPLADLLDPLTRCRCFYLSASHLLRMLCHSRNRSQTFIAAVKNMIESGLSSRSPKDDEVIPHRFNCFGHVTCPSGYRRRRCGQNVFHTPTVQ